MGSVARPLGKLPDRSRGQHRLCRQGLCRLCARAAASGQPRVVAGRDLRGRARRALREARPKRPCTKGKRGSLLDELPALIDRSMIAVADIFHAARGRRGASSPCDVFERALEQATPMPTSADTAHTSRHSPQTAVSHLKRESSRGPPAVGEGSWRPTGMVVTEAVTTSKLIMPFAGQGFRVPAPVKQRVGHIGRRSRRPA